MRVLVVDQFAYLGGGQLCLLDLLPAFRDRGWQVHAALPSDGPFATRLIAGGASVDFFGGCSYRQSRKSVADMVRFPVDAFRQARHIAKWAQRTKSDLVYVNGPRVLLAAALAAGRVPLLFHAHSHVSQRVAQAVATTCVRARAAAVIACSHSVGRHYRLSAAAGKLSVIRNGVADAGYRKRFLSPVRNPRIGIIGNFGPDKGHIEFLQCARILAERISGIRFTVCGSLNEPATAYAQAIMTASAGLPVDWLGWREDVAQVLAQLDILVIPSAIEGLPRVMLEAFSAGVPVVAFPSGGIPEVIRDDDTGFLVPERSADALARKIETVLNVDGELCRVSANARREWESTYNVHRYRADVLTVIDRVVSRVAEY